MEAKFEPNLLNTAIYLLSLSQQVSTFAINFQVSLLYYISYTWAKILIFFYISRADHSVKVFEKILHYGGVLLVQALSPFQERWILCLNLIDGYRL
jgi:hypothetical protein